VLQLRLYLLLMLHLLILGQQQLGPRLGRRSVMLPPCARRGVSRRNVPTRRAR